MSQVPHPIPYQGSKRNIAAQILKYIPSGTETLYEPFAGSAAFSLATAFHGKASNFFINDINGPLVELLKKIINQPEVIFEEYNQLWYEQLGQEKEFYNLVRDRFNTSKEPRYLYYLLARCVKAAVRYNSNGEFNQSPDNRRKGAKPDTVKRHIIQASALLKGKTTFSSKDYKEVVSLANNQDVIYMDPPYQGVTKTNDKRYIQGLNYEEFVSTLEMLNTNGISYIISFDGTKGNKKYGENLPEFLGLIRLDINAGRSSQSTLLGSDEITIESLYISPALQNRLQLQTPQGALILT